MKQTANLEIFEHAPVRRAVVAQIFPSIAGQMIILVYNLADTYFVGMLNAPHETAAVTVVYPCFIMLTAVSNLFGVGGASAIARALGKKMRQTHGGFPRSPSMEGRSPAFCFLWLLLCWPLRFFMYAEQRRRPIQLHTDMRCGWWFWEALLRF